MVSKYNIIQYLKDHPQLDINYDAEKDVFLIDALDEKHTILHIPSEEFTNKIRESMHCDFDVIYSDVLNNVVYRCNQCGCVIITGDDERFDPNLCCPDCGQYKTTHGEEVYTKKDQENPEVKKLIEQYIEIDKHQQKYYKWLQNRREKRKKKGKRELYSDELWRKDFYWKKSGLTIALKVSNLYNSGLKNLHFYWATMERDCEDSISYTYKTFHNFPLSPYAVWFFWIFPHTKKYKEVFNKK